MKSITLKTSALVLALCLVLSCVPVFAATASDETEAITVWNGDVTAPKDSNGDGVYEISTPQELAYAVSNGTVSKKYVLTNDIYLNEVGAVNWSNGQVNDGFTPIEWFENKIFCGFFDGQGHTVFGIYYPVGNNTGSGSDVSVGLFPIIADGTTIKNLGIKYSYLDTVGYAGAIAGHSKNVSNVLFENCFSDDTVTVKSYKPSEKPNNCGTAGILGADANGSNKKFLNCYTSANISCGEPDRCNGLVGDIWVSNAKPVIEIENCFTKGSKPVRAGGNNTTAASFKNVYSTEADVKTYGGWTQVTAAEMASFAALKSMADLGEAFVTGPKHPLLKDFIDEINNLENIPLGTEFLKGSGSETDPFIISTTAELYYAVGSFGGGKFYKLSNDIFINSISSVDWSNGTVKEGHNPKEWFYGNLLEGTKYKGIDGSYSTFSGTIDGNGYSICGLYYSYGNNYTSVGLVPNASSVTIKNLSIENSYIGGGRFVGAFTSYSATTSLENCYVADSTTVNLWNSGADYATETCANANDYSFQATKNADGTFSKVYFESSAVGGLVARNTNGGKISIVNCGFAGKLERVAVKGFGKNNPNITVKDALTYGTANGHIGGFIGDDWGAASVTVKNGFSISEPHAQFITGAEGVYTCAGTLYNLLTPEQMQGENALSNMPLLSNDVWYSVKSEGAYPVLRVRGEACGDVDEDGIGMMDGDLSALRKGIIGAAEAQNGNYNRTGDIDICDLVALSEAILNISTETCTHIMTEETIVKSTYDTDGIIRHYCRRCGYDCEENIGTSISLLAIGSSHTMNSITYFGDICEAAGIDNVYLGHMYKGGVTFQQQYEDATGIDTDGDGNTEHTFIYRTYKDSEWSAYSSGKHVADIIGTRDWDFVVINQGAIDAPLYGQELLNGDVKDSYETYFDWQVDYITSLAPNATLCWNMTFACEEYEAGDPRYDECDLRWQYKNWFGFDSHVMYNAIAAAAEKYVMPKEEIEIFLPSATTVQNVRSSYKGHTLTNDLTHLDDDPENLHGRYAVGLTWFKAITGADLSTFNWVPADNLTDDLPMIREAVNNAITNPLTETESSFK